MNPDAQTSLDSKLRQWDVQILNLKQELDVLRRYINALTRPSGAKLPPYDEKMEMEHEEGDQDDEQSEPTNHDSNDERDDEIEDACLPEYWTDSAIHTRADWSISAKWPPKSPLDHNYSITTTSLSIHPDRRLMPRATTPLREVDSACNPIPPLEYRRSTSNWPKISPDRTEEYMQLLKRGANQILEAFAGPLMQRGDFWKIHLGRQIQLDADDVDGSVFIEDLLEDAVMFPMRVEGCTKTHERWETKEETPGIWVTRLKAHKEDDPEEEDRCDGSDSDEDSECCYGYMFGSAHAEDVALEQPPMGGPVALNEYLPTSDDDDEGLLGDEDISMSEGDSDDYASPSSRNSDSEDVEVYDTAFVWLTGPDRVWDLDMDDSSEGEDSQLLDGRDTA
ncbi:hypothetical protein D9619_009330 [Psilocybe cf. subviscida]|uniref:Uncharacterized protein n=1 Tax=Psilocybe cf. subviscida TaxID=2480587 RepID=A0A8H5FAK0_9AGAR|nr:hypothetical protein D9619_009330 [Psilocybe cf. subviscida]